MKLEGKTAFITGGSDGIGKAAARAFLLHGASVVINGRDAERLAGAVRELGTLGDIDGISGDISKPDDVADIARLLNRNWSELDILVNNASMLGPRVSISDYPEDAWVRVIEVNLNGQFFVTKALLPMLLSSESASIINVSSGVGRIGKARWGAYSASKFGVESLNQTLADELGETGVRVNAVDPGGTRTSMRAAAYPDEDPMTLPTPDEIMPVFIHLASDDSIGETGGCLKARDWINNNN